MALADDFGFGSNILSDIFPVDRPIRSEIENEVDAVKRRPLVWVFAVDCREREVVVLKSLADKARIGIARICQE